MFAFRCMKWGKSYIPLQQQKKLKSTFRRGINFLFKENLLVTNSITSGAFIAIGDFLQQGYQLQAKDLLEQYDWPRTVRMFLVGVMLGSLHHYYYVKLDKILPKVDFSTITKKVLCDQLVVSPLTIICFFYGMGILERKSMEQSTDEIARKFKYVYMGDCFFWIPVQYINFYYLPTEYRVVYINLATMVFNIFLSYMKHFDQH